MTEPERRALRERISDATRARLPKSPGRHGPPWRPRTPQPLSREQIAATIEQAAAVNADRLRRLTAACATGSTVNRRYHAAMVVLTLEKAGAK